MFKYTEEEYAEMARQLKERGVLKIRNIQVTKCVLLSLTEKLSWKRLFQGIAFIEPIKTFKPNVCNQVYDIWGCVTHNGEYYDTFMLLSNEQSLFLQKEWDMSDNTTITLPPYSDDLAMSKYISGGKLAETYSKDPELMKLLSHSHMANDNAH